MPELLEEMITRPQDLAACCAYLAQCQEFGLDTEFVGEETYHPRLCLVQVATTERLILIDPISAGPLDAFWELVIDPSIRIIVHGGREEIRLCHLWTGKVPTNLLDVQIAAGLTGLPYPLGHAALVGQVLGVQLRKAETLTEWRTRPLTRQQVQYAFDDVRYLLHLWHQLSNQLEQRGRLDWLREEMARLAGNATLEDPAQVERWRKLRGLGSLDRRRLAMVRALHAWREETAARTNRPARSIVRDDLLIEIVRRNPSRARDLQVIRGLPHRDLDAIMKVLERARVVPLEDCPRAAERENDPPQVTLVGNILVAVLADLCARERLAPNLVASNQDVKLLVRALLQRRAIPAESLLSNGWRGVHVLPQLRAVLEGRCTLRIANAMCEAPLALEPYTNEHPVEPACGVTPSTKPRIQAENN